MLFGNSWDKQTLVVLFIKKVDLHFEGKFILTSEKNSTDQRFCLEQ